LAGMVCVGHALTRPLVRPVVRTDGNGFPVGERAGIAVCAWPRLRQEQALHRGVQGAVRRGMQRGHEVVDGSAAVRWQFEACRRHTLRRRSHALVPPHSNCIRGCVICAVGLWCRGRAGTATLRRCTRIFATRAWLRASYRRCPTS
jgi:hypothetical protein